jgi:hypothetical protein
MVMLPHEILEERQTPEPLVSVPDTPLKVMPLTSRRTGEDRPDDEPPVEEWRRQGLAVVATEPTVTADDPGVPAPFPLSADEPVVASATPADAPPFEAPADDDAFSDTVGPLPSRVPGHSMSHQPSAPVDVVAPDADPLRPYHVHELLTRHQLGKRRGQAEGPGTDPDWAPDSEDELP